MNSKQKQKKIGILTYHGGFSHGALLQCYASLLFFSNYNYEVEVINYIRSIKNQKKYTLRSLISLAYSFIDKLLNFQNYKMRDKNFNVFREKMKITEKLLESYKDVKDAQLDYDIYFVGSDQVWNPEITNGLDEVFLLKFVNKGKKCSLSASIGIEISDDLIKKLEPNLNDFDLITVREKETFDALSKIYPEVKLTCDPVFLLDRNIWLNLLRPIDVSSDKYLFVYNISYDPFVYEIADLISKKYDLKIISLGFNKLYRRGGNNVREVYGLGPLELLSYIYYASFIITTSFHGAAFSLIFNKEFRVVLPEERKGRIYELMSKYSLNNCIFTKNSEIDYEYKINYTSINNSIKEEIEYAKKIFETVL